MSELEKLDEIADLLRKQNKLMILLIEESSPKSVVAGKTLSSKIQKILEND